MFADGMLRQTGCALCIARLPHNWTANWQLHIAPLKLNKIKRRQQNREIQNIRKSTRYPLSKMAREGDNTSFTG